jgi:hypothetical protein
LNHRWLRILEAKEVTADWCLVTGSPVSLCVRPSAAALEQ